MDLRLACLNDAKFLFELRNHVSNRAMFKDSGVIKWEDHINWLESHLKIDFFFLYIGTYQKRDIGQFRITPDGDVSVALIEDVKGLGLGSQLISAASKLYRSMFPNQLVARIKSENLASIKSFTKAGYVFTEKFADSGINYEIYIFKGVDP